MEISDRLDVQLATVEAGAQCHLYRQLITIRLRFREEFSGGSLVPFGNTPVFGKPLAMGARGIGTEAGDCGEQANPVASVRIASVEIMLGQGADKPVPSKDQGERFQYGAFPRTIRPHEHRLALTELDHRAFHPAEVLNSKLPNPHVPSPPVL